MKMRTTSRYPIVGGPCSGKSTGLPYIAERSANLGYFPLIVPEAATLLINTGLDPRNKNVSLEYFQREVFKTSLYLEDKMEKCAEGIKHLKPLIFCDRGIMDAKAYCPPGLFEEIAKDHKLSVVDIRDGRYDAVFHLRTAPEKFYTLENNKARLETYAEACINDEKTLNTWIGHEHLRVIDNSTDFEGKMKRLFGEICSHLGIPVPLEIEHKFLVESIDPKKIPVPYQAIDIEQRYMASPDSETIIRIRKRGQYNSYTYYKTIKRDIGDGSRFETQNQISANEYAKNTLLQNPSTIIVRKKRYCFMYKDQYFELDVFDEPYKGLYVLEIEVTDWNKVVAIPPFIKVVADVTHNKSYSNYALAQKSTVLKPPRFA